MMTSDEMMVIVNRVRQELQRETGACCDAAYAAILVALTFELDHHADRKLAPDVARKYLFELVRKVVRDAEHGRMQLVRVQ